ncbi:MAG: CoA-binding protein [Bacteroidetes bacterium 4572_77]|nr:MAG: CoA-binding protein [Bacteroidetes bacterium 4572_77]
MNKKTLVLGGSPKPERYSNKAILMLLENNHDVVSVGARNATVSSVKIHKEKLHFNDIHTVTMYLGPKNQIDFYNYIIKLNPKRIIFNPGTENQELEELAKENGIETEEACTLVLLTTNQY